METDDVYRALVADLAHSILPTTIMGVTLVGIGLFAADVLGSQAAMVAAVIGGLASLAKISLIVAHLARNRRGPVERPETKRWEGGHAIATVLVAIAVSVLASTTFVHPDQSMQMLATALLFGYCSGIVTRISIRPRIACAALTLAVAPTAFAAGLVGDAPHHIVATMFAVFLLGAYESVRFTYGGAVRQIRLRLDMGVLARGDPLTGLANRLGLREAFHAPPPAPGRLVAVHCLDLDGFKPVNDCYGHAAGDAVLCGVADRLRAVVSEGDTVARTGGDEFVILQRSAMGSDNIDRLSEAIARALGEPYMIDGQPIRVGASLGHACAPTASADLNVMLRLADAACYRDKRNSRTAGTASAASTMPSFPISPARGEAAITGACR